MAEEIRNLAIVAHVDHGKTTLVDALLRQSDTLGERDALPERALDSNALERERGITILAKNTALRWRGYRFNLVDTPGHADFGGEVERVLSMADAALVLVDAVDGPMPQTRFVCRKAFEHGLRPIVVVNKVDRPAARPERALDATFDLFCALGATDEQLDFPVVYASALEGWASLEPAERSAGMTPLFEALAAHAPPPRVEPEGPLQLQVSALDYDPYAGAIGIGRIARGRLRRGAEVAVVDREGGVRSERVLQVLGFLGLRRVEVEEAAAGDIVAFTGLPAPRISDTLCDPEAPRALPPLRVDEPTIRMGFETNTSPFAGREGRFVTSRQIWERLQREALHNVALRVEAARDPERFRVSGRGELHLGILLETLRREGFELAVSRPEVVLREVEGELHEPVERLVADVEEGHQGRVMEALGERGGSLQDLSVEGSGRVRLEYTVPSRGLIGFQSELRTLTSGSALLHHVFDHYAPRRDGRLASRPTGVLVSNAEGKAVAFALAGLQERGRLFVAPGEPVYEGQIVGESSRPGDLTVNPLKEKALTNVRAAGRDESVQLTPPRRFTLESAMEFIDEEELVEVTPKGLRLRKRHRSEAERRRLRRAAARAEEGGRGPPGGAEHAGRVA